MAFAVDDLPAPLAAPGARAAAWDPVAIVGPAAVGIAVLGVLAALRDHVVAADWVRLALIAAWAFAGAALLRQQALKRLGHLVLGGSLLGALSFAAARHADTSRGSGADAAGLIAPLACLALVALTAHVLLALPDGVLGSRLRRLGAASGHTVAAVAGILIWAGPGQVSVTAGAVAWSVAVLVALPAAHRSYLASAGVVRQRLQWIGCGAALAGEVAITMGALSVFVGWPSHAGAVAASGTVMIPLAIAASASHRLAGRADRALVHTVSAVGVTLVVVVVYVLVVLGIGRAPTKAERQILGLSMIAAALAAVAYVPARGRLDEFAKRVVYGERTAPDETLRSFGQRLSRAIPMDELLLQLVESLRKTMALTAAEIWTGSGNVLERTVSVPDRARKPLNVGERERPVVARAGVVGNAWIAVWMPDLLEDRGDASVRLAPIVHSGELLGAIVLERPARADAFTEEDDRVLAEIARQVGLALHNLRLDSALQESLDQVRRQAEELQASRARIVAAADSERRKIERNLHDGAQQHLVALAVNLRLARDSVGEDPAGAAEMLDALAADVKETIQELRDLAHGIYPPLLLDSGLFEALKAAANRSPLVVALDGDGIGRYPTEVEAAAYFCCLEALQNAAKHAPEANVIIRVREEAGALLFEVSDDGPGFDTIAASKGHGFLNMADRVGAIGGTVRWDSAPGEGVTIRGTIPLS